MLDSLKCVNTMQWTIHSLDPNFANPTQTDTSGFSLANLDLTYYNKLVAVTFILEDVGQYLDFLNTINPLEDVTLQAIVALQISFQGSDDLLVGPYPISPLNWFLDVNAHTGTSTEEPMLVIRSGIPGGQSTGGEGGSFLYMPGGEYPVVAGASMLQFLPGGYTNPITVKVVALGR